MGEPRLRPGLFRVLWAFFREGFGEIGVSLWFVCGQNVVKRVVKVVSGLSFGAG
jgi:hypothetical protein